VAGKRVASPCILVFAAALAPACDRAPSAVPGSASGAPPSAAAGQATTGQAPAGQAPIGQAPSVRAKVDVGPAAVDVVEEWTGGAKSGDAVPLIVAIHGLGDRPSAFAGLFRGFGARAHLVLPAGGLGWGGGFAWWPIHGHIDADNMAAGLGAAADRLAAAIPSWQPAGGAGKTIVTGFSQGGMLSFAIAVKHPRLVGEVVPVAGLLPTSMTPAAWPAGAPMPRVFALHGDADGRVPFAHGQKTVEALRGLGLRVELKSYSGIEHSVSPEMRRDWLAALEAAVQRAGQ
jgi:phospholipase/carboxylesterase